MTALLKAEPISRTPHGLYHYRARAYSPEMRRFIQRDPLEYVDGANAVGYTAANPALRSDPLGLEDVEDPEGQREGADRIDPQDGVDGDVQLKYRELRLKKLLKSTGLFQEDWGAMFRQTSNMKRKWFPGLVNQGRFDGGTIWVGGDPLPPSAGGSTSNMDDCCPDWESLTEAWSTILHEVGHGSGQYGADDKSGGHEGLETRVAITLADLAVKLREDPELGEANCPRNCGCGNSLSAALIKAAYRAAARAEKNHFEKYGNAPGGDHAKKQVDAAVRRME